MNPNQLGSSPEQQPNTGTETGLTDTHKDEPKKRKGLRAMMAVVTGLFAVGGIAGSAHNDDKANAKTGPHPTNEYAEPHPAGPQSDDPESIIGTVDTSNNPGGGQGIEDASDNGKPNTGFVPLRAEDTPAVPNFNGNPSVEVAPAEVIQGVENQTSSDASERPNTSKEGANPVESSANPLADSYTIPVVPSSSEVDPTTEPGPGVSADPGDTTPER